MDGFRIIHAFTASGLVEVDAVDEFAFGCEDVIALTGTMVFIGVTEERSGGLVDDSFEVVGDMVFAIPDHFIGVGRHKHEIGSEGCDFGR